MQSQEHLELKLLDVIREQLPSDTADELVFFFEDDPPMFATVAFGKVAAGDLVLSDELTDILRCILQQSQRVVPWEPMAGGG